MSENYEILAGSRCWITLSGQPDLVITGLLIFPLIAARGSISIVAFTIRNQGNAPAGPSNHKIWLVTPPEFGITRPDILLGTVNTGTLAPGASASFADGADSVKS